MFLITCECFILRSVDSPPANIRFCLKGIEPMNPVSNRRTITFLGATFLLLIPAAAQNKPDKKLEQAIAVLRRVDQGKLSEQQQKAKAKEIDEAWGVIKAAGKAGVVRLKEEIRLIDQNKEKDDYF